MPDVVVKPVNSWRAKKQFLRLPWKLYSDDANWIPPLRRNQAELVGYRRHPFHDVAEVQTFLAYRDGQPQGRIAAIVYHAHIERHNEKLGFFGFFESINDQQVASALFDAARDWLAQQGMQAIRGPMNPSIHYEIGLLIDGFDSPPRFMMTYNPPYYADLIEGYGFRKAQDLYAYWGHVEMIESLDHKLSFIIQEATKRFRIKLRQFDRSRFRDEVLQFLEIYNEASSGQWGFVPLSKGEVEHISASLRHLICPEMTAVAEIDGRPVGAVFALLDYNPRIREIDGRLFPFGFLRLLSNRRAIKEIRIIAAEVLPEFQRWGVGLVVLASLVPAVLRWGITGAEFSWVLESNQLSRGSLERGGAQRIKTYRLYDYDITPH